MVPKSHRHTAQNSSVLPWMMMILSGTATSGEREDPALNKRLYAIRRLANHIPRNMLKNVANSLWTFKLRYGLQLSARVRLKEEETEDGNMKAVQIAQNKQLTKDTTKCKQYNFVTGSKGRNNVTSLDIATHFNRLKFYRCLV